MVFLINCQDAKEHLSVWCLKKQLLAVIGLCVWAGPLCTQDRHGWTLLWCILHATFRLTAVFPFLEKHSNTVSISKISCICQGTHTVSVQTETLHSLDTAQEMKNPWHLCMKTDPVPLTEGVFISFALKRLYF